MLLKNFVKVFIVSLLFVNFTYAQSEDNQKGNFTDGELSSFIDIDTKLREIQKGAQTSIVKAIQDNGMEVNRYQEIFRAKNKGEEIEMKEGESAAFTKIQEVIKEQQGKMRKKADEIFKSSDLPRARFNEIRKATVQDPDLKDRIKKLQAEKVKE